MKGKNTYQFKKILFQSSRIDIAGGWHVGNKADNPACRYPKRGTDRDLIYNHSAITLENLMSGKLKAALLNMEDGTQILYFQYQSSTNGQIQAVVMPEHPMRIEVDRDVDDHYASYLAVQFMSACYFLISPDASPYGSIREGLKDVQDMARQICGAEPGILQGVIGQALEYPYIFKYNGYYEMRRHPLTVFVGTMNPEAEGTRALNEALASRFSYTVIVEPAPRAEMANILSSGGFKKRDCMKVIRIYEKILKYLEKYDPELTARISMRACRECLVNLRCGFDWAQAVEQSFIGQIYAASPAVAGDIRTTLKLLLA